MRCNSFLKRHFTVTALWKQFPKSRIRKKESDTLKRVLVFFPRENYMLLDIINLPLETESGIKIVELLLPETKQIKSNPFVFIVCEEIEA